MGVRGLLSIVIVGLLAGGAHQAWGAPETWDSRLDELGVYWLEAEATPGEWYWRLVSGVYEDENESDGNHNIYYKALDADGSPIEGQRCWAAWPTGAVEEAVDLYTKGAVDDYWGNFAMYGGWCPYYPEGPHGPYGAYVDGPTDEVWGMGLPCNIHVNFRLVWQWSQKTEPAAPALLEVSPLALNPATQEGINPSDDQIIVANLGESPLHYTVQPDVAWIEVNPASGVIESGEGSPEVLDVSYTVSDLPAGQYSGVIWVDGGGAGNSPQAVSVALSISSAPACSPERLEQRGDGHGPTAFGALGLLLGAPFLLIGRARRRG